MKRLALVLIILGVLSGCATVPPDKVAAIWTEVEAEYPGVKAEMPTIVWTDEDIYLHRDGRDVFCNGAYTRSTNKVYLRKWWADEDTVAHEFRHAHGDMLGEKTGRLVTVKGDRTPDKPAATDTSGHEKLQRITSTAMPPVIEQNQITVSALPPPRGSDYDWTGGAGLYHIIETALPPDVATRR